MVVREIVRKNFLTAEDVSEIFGCSKSKSYQIINDVNEDLEKKGHNTFNGRVLAPALYKKYGLDMYLSAYEKI
ncbi:MAG: DNA-binding protein [Erysipelotrichaceae bacterium]|nr:DNA-binding protein [Erysipelotrichaceae bacterium]